MYSYTENKFLYKSVYEMPKDATSLFYFTLEANEGICFYSTLAFEKGEKTRKVVVHYTPELQHEFRQIISSLSSMISLTTITKNEKVLDLN